MTTFNVNLMENFKGEAKTLACEAKRLEVITEKNPICSEAAELLADITERLNTLGHMVDRIKEGMKDEAEAHSAGLVRAVRPVKVSSRAQRVSAGERAKRQAVKRGATLIRGAF
ncbi:hypothetical protein G5574_11405 [Pantoea stewartii]|uniref:hypothetical protein n=1 Tax=Pantoea stewartii TaxID=66269 RepID=UPI0013DDD444|nr:hypothetical protein [Pantoea stewartii]QIE97526.1 hypothetical protein G5574_11405 [Pantoea stewartii]